MKQTHASRSRMGFTLIELLVAIGILGLMAGLALYSLLGARTDAKNARTRGTIQKLNEIILQRWEEYRYRPVNLPLPDFLETPVRLPGSSGLLMPVSPRELARVRMVVLRDTMRMELPDRISDLLYGPTHYTILTRETDTVNGGVLGTKLPRPLPPGWGVIYKALYNRVAALKQAGHPSWADLSMANIELPTRTPISYASGTVSAFAGIEFLGTYTGQTTVADAEIAWREAVDSSELLYLIISTSNYNGSSALEFFRPSEIGDPDGDGLLEFIDAWSQPIQWIRWPAGYPGDLVRYAGADAMDPLKTDWRYRNIVGGATIDEDWKPKTLVPLIVSPGLDGQLGIIRDYYNAGNPQVAPVAYATMTWPTAVNGTPYGTTSQDFAGTVSSGQHYRYGTPPGTYYYPDPHFTWEIDPNNGARYQPSLMHTGAKPFDTQTSPGAIYGYRANQMGSIPNYIDSGNTIPNTFWTDNITNHDIILEP